MRVTAACARGLSARSVDNPDASQSARNATSSDSCCAVAFRSFSSGSELLLRVQTHRCARCDHSRELNAGSLPKHLVGALFPIAARLDDASFARLLDGVAELYRVASERSAAFALPFPFSIGGVAADVFEVFALRRSLGASDDEVGMRRRLAFNDVEQVQTGERAEPHFSPANDNGEDCFSGRKTRVQPGVMQVTRKFVCKPERRRLQREVPAWRGDHCRAYPREWSGLRLALRHGRRIAHGKRIELLVYSSRRAVRRQRLAFCGFVFSLVNCHSITFRDRFNFARLVNLFPPNRHIEA